MRESRGRADGIIFFTSAVCKCLIEHQFRAPCQPRWKVDAALLYCLQTPRPSAKWQARQSSQGDATKHRYGIQSRQARLSADRSELSCVDTVDSNYPALAIAGNARYWIARSPRHPDATRYQTYSKPTPHRARPLPRASPLAARLTPDQTRRHRPAPTIVLTPIASRELAAFPLVSRALSVHRWPVMGRLNAYLKDTHHETDADQRHAA